MTAPSLPAVPSPPAAQLPAVPQAPPAGTTSARALGQALGAATSEVAAAPGELASRPGEQTGGTGGAQQRPGGWTRGERTRVQRLKREVRAYRACFSVLSRRSQRILRFHLGLRPARRPHSREAVGRRFGISTRAVARRERRSFVRLRRAARAGECDSVVAAGTAAGGSSGGSVFSLASTGTQAGLGGEEDRVVVGGVHESGGDKSGSTEKQGLIPGGTPFVGNLGDDLRDIAGIVIAMLAAALLLAMYVLHRKGALERPAWLSRSRDSS